MLNSSTGQLDVSKPGPRRGIRLRSGVFTVRGRQLRLGTGEYPSLDVPIEIFSAFDYDRDMFRYESRKPRRVFKETMQAGKMTLESLKRGPSSKEYVERDTIEKYARGPRQAITCATLILTPSDSTPCHSLCAGSGCYPPFDVRIVGLALWHTVVEGGSYSDVSESLSKWEMEEAAHEGGGRYRCVWIHVGNGLRKDEARHRVWFDERQGFRSVRSELRIARAAIPGFPAEHWLQEKVMPRGSAFMKSGCKDL